MANDTTMTIVGNLTDDPELRFTATGTAVAAFTIASTPRRYNQLTGEWDDGDTLFLRCAAWRDLGEHVCESLRRGYRVIATGRLRTSTWETNEGEKRSRLELDVDDIGASLRYAVAKVARIARDDGSLAPAADPWARSTRTPAIAPAGVPAGAVAGNGNVPAERDPASDAPPF